MTHEVPGPGYTFVQLTSSNLNRILRAVVVTLALESRIATETNPVTKYGLKKTKNKNKQSFDSHAVDSWVMAAEVTGAEKPSCTRLWYIVGTQLHRRQLHRFQASKGGERKPYGGTRSLGLKRGTVVKHAKYGACTVGGFDRKRNTMSLHAYRTNKRLTQGAKVEACRTLTWVAFRAFLVTKEFPRKSGKGGHLTQATRKGTPVSSHRMKADGNQNRRIYT